MALDLLRSLDLTVTAGPRNPMMAIRYKLTFAVSLRLPQSLPASHLNVDEGRRMVRLGALGKMRDRPWRSRCFPKCNAFSSSKGSAAAEELSLSLVAAPNLRRFNGPLWTGR